MKKIVIAIAMAALAFSAQADLVNGEFTTAGFVATSTSIQQSAGAYDAGWYLAAANVATNAGGVLTFRDADVAGTAWVNAIGQMWTDTLTGIQKVQIDFTLVDVASLTAPILQIEVLEFSATATNSKMRNGFPANDTKISSLYLTSIDLTTQAVGIWESAAIDFTGKSGKYGIRLSFEGTADAGDNDNLEMTSVGVVPEPATALLLGVGGVGAWMLRRNLRKSKEEQEG